MKKLQGSLTAEMALVFPVLLILLVFVMIYGIASIAALNSSIAMGEGLMILETASKEGKKEAGLESLTKAYVLDKAGSKGAFSTAEVSVVNTFFQKAAEVKVDGWLFSLPLNDWSFHQKKNMVDPVRFRNRVDLISEAGSS